MLETSAKTNPFEVCVADLAVSCFRLKVTVVNAHDISPAGLGLHPRIIECRLPDSIVRTIRMSALGGKWTLRPALSSARSGEGLSEARLRVRSLHHNPVERHNHRPSR